jgi:acetylornithine deacetylase/succinyl-diaminopimelate desuccinylase-like protein
MRLSFDSTLAYLTLLFCAVLYSLHLWLSQPPEVVKLDAPAEAFSAERALVVLEDLLQQNQPHPVGSAANQFVRSRIEHRLNELGISYDIQTTWACRFQSNRCAEVENIIATIPGNSAQKSVLLMAHYDSVPTSVGAGDDAAAVAAILESARALVLEAPLPRPVVLLFTDGEETGLLGPKLFFRMKRSYRTSVLF